jgi:hypothetical protein
MARNKFISYVTRDFDTLLSQFNAVSDFRKYAEFIKRMFAGPFDVLNSTLNANFNSLFLRTVNSRPEAQDTLRLIDYQLGWISTSNTTVVVTIDSAVTASSSYIVAQNDLKGQIPATDTSAAQLWEARDSLSFAIGETVKTIQFYQQETRSPAILDYPTTGESWQQYDLPENGILSKTLVVEVDTIGVFTLVDTFASSSTTDQHFRFIQKSDGSSAIKFGGINDRTGEQYGYIPGSDLEITVTYAIGGGTDSLIDSGDLTTYTGSDSNVISISNNDNASGGENQETLENASEIAPLNLRLNTGFFGNESSGIALAKQVDGVYRAFIDYSGLLETDAYIIPTDGGTPSSTLLANVETKLEGAAPFGAITVNVSGADYVTTSVQGIYGLKAGYDETETLKYAKLAGVLRLSPLMAKLKTILTESGLSSNFFTELNNAASSITGDSYSTSDDIDQISKIIRNVDSQEFGEMFYPEDVTTAIQGFVDGVDYFITSIPVGPISPADYQLVNISSISISKDV